MLGLFQDWTRGQLIPAYEFVFNFPRFAHWVDTVKEFLFVLVAHSLKHIIILHALIILHNVTCFLDLLIAYSCWPCRTISVGHYSGAELNWTEFIYLITIKQLYTEIWHKNILSGNKSIDFCKACVSVEIYSLHLKLQSLLILKWSTNLAVLFKYSF
jgi:hypothetical protein